MSKIDYDKYYTSPIVAKWCIEKVYEVIGKENITEIIEPSAGSGSFSHQLDCKAYDLYPQHEYIEEMDFTKLQLEYKKGRLFIGNPPFGAADGGLIKAFYNIAVKNGDYVAYILPANYYDNYKRFNKFEIVYNCILESEYTNVLLTTSFVIYRRNDNWKLPEHIPLKDVTMIRYNRKTSKEKIKEGAIQTNKKVINDYDTCIIAYGNLMQKCQPYEKVAAISIKVNNLSLKKEILNAIEFMAHKHQRDKFLSKRAISTASFGVKDIERLLKICVPNIK